RLHVRAGAQRCHQVFDVLWNMLNDAIQCTGSNVSDRLDNLVELYVQSVIRAACGVQASFIWAYMNPIQVHVILTAHADANLLIAWQKVYGTGRPGLELPPIANLRDVKAFK